MVATTSIDFTLTFSGLSGYTSESGLKYGVNVVGSGNPSVTECESGNAFSDTVGIGHDKQWDRYCSGNDSGHMLTWPSHPGRQPL